MHLGFRLQLNAIIRELSRHCWVQDLQCVWLQLLFDFDLTRASGGRRRRRRSRDRTNNQHFTQYIVGHPQSLQLISLSIWLWSLLILQSVRITAGVCVRVCVFVGGQPAFNGKCVDKSQAKARTACHGEADAEPRLAWKLFLIAAI